MKKGITLAEAQKIAFEKKNPEEYFNEYFTEWNGYYVFQYYPNDLGYGNYGLPMFLLIKKTDGSCRECTAEERDKILRS